MLNEIFLALLVSSLFCCCMKYAMARRGPTKIRKRRTLKTQVPCRKRFSKKLSRVSIKVIQCEAWQPPIVHEETLLRSAEDEGIPHSHSYLAGFLGQSTTTPVKFFIDLLCSKSFIAVSCVETLGLLQQVNWKESRMFKDRFGVRYTYGTLHVPVKTSSGFILLEEISVAETPNGVDAILGQDFFWDHPCEIFVRTDSVKLQVRDKDFCRPPNVLLALNYSTED